MNDSYCQLSVEQSFEGVDEEKLGDRIQSLMQSLRGQTGRAGSARRLHELYKLLLLDAKIEEARRADGNSTQNGSAPHAFSGRRSNARSGPSPDTEDTSSQPLPQEFAVEAPRPNPTRSGATVPLALPEEATVHAAVYDMLGRRVEQITSRSFPAGRSDLSIPTKSLSGGVYLIRVQVEGASGQRRVSTDKITVVK